MRILIDDTLPYELKFEFPDSQVMTVEEMGWSKLDKTTLLFLARVQFDIFITTKEAMKDYSDSFADIAGIKIIVVDAPDYELETLQPIIPEIVERVNYVYDQKYNSLIASVPSYKITRQTVKKILTFILFMVSSFYVWSAITEGKIYNDEVMEISCLKWEDNHRFLGADISVDPYVEHHILIDTQKERGRLVEQNFCPNMPLSSEIGKKDANKYEYLGYIDIVNYSPDHSKVAIVAYPEGIYSQTGLIYITDANNPKNPETLYRYSAILRYSKSNFLGIQVENWLLTPLILIMFGISSLGMFRLMISLRNHWIATCLFFMIFFIFVCQLLALVAYDTRWVTS